MADLAPFAVLGLVGVLLAVSMSRRLRRQGFRPVDPPWIGQRHTFDPASSARLTGGARIGHLNASAPFVTLDLDESWAHLGLFGEVWIDRNVVVAVVPIRGTLSSGLRFETADGALDGVIFWTRDVSHALSRFERFGWPVRRTRKRGSPST